MISLAAFAILLFAVSLIVSYMLIIHRALSGSAANDPAYDIDAPVRVGRGQSTASVSAVAAHSVRATAKHA